MSFHSVFVHTKKESNAVHFVGCGSAFSMFPVMYTDLCMLKLEGPLVTSPLFIMIFYEPNQGCRVCSKAINV